jgi:hypothetical protein
MKKQKSVLEIESELYSLVKTLKRIHERYKKGEIQENFYLKSIKSTIRELIQFKFELQEKNVQMKDFLQKVEFSDDYFKIVDIINNVSNLKSNPNTLDQKKISTKQGMNAKIQRAVLELPGLSTEITTAFITLMDALKLGDIASGKLLKKLFSDLLSALQRFPGLDDLSKKIETLSNKINKLQDDEVQNTQDQENLVDQIYTIFNAFKNKLNI